MKNLKHLTAFIVSLLIIISSCKKDSESPLSTDTRIAGKPETKMALSARAKLSKLRSSLPAGYKIRLQKSADKLIIAHPQYRNAVRRALAIEPTDCNDATPVRQWLNAELSDWDDDMIFFALITGMLDFPTYDALFFENSSSGQRFGTDGQYSQTVNKTFKDLKRFWNIQSNGIVLAGLHGDMLRDREKLIRMDQIIFGDSREVAEFWADLILSLLNDFPQFRNGDHPIFTFNGFALAQTNLPDPIGFVPDKIILGDGLLEGYTAVGFKDIAPQAVLAHEFGHHIQFQLNLIEFGGPEGTRKNELMADAYSAYYLSHARGASMQWKRVQQFLQVFFNIGDCSFDSDGHHGTPAERMAAARWGYTIANNAQKQGHILSSQQFAALFNAQLPLLVAR